MEVSRDDKEVIAYLLGDLTDSERDALDVRFSIEPSFTETAMAIEDDLLMEYARGGLSSTIRARIEKAYNETPARRARLDAAFAFLNSIPRTEGAQPRPGPRQTARRSRYFIVSMLVAAALLLVIWFPSVKHFENHQVVPDASFELQPGLTRSGPGRQIALPPGARTIAFELQIPDQMNFRNWRVSLGTVEHPASWSGPVSLRDRLVVTAVPTSVLAPGDYTLRLYGGNADTEMQERAAYYFRIE